LSHSCANNYRFDNEVAGASAYSPQGDKLNPIRDYRTSQFKTGTSTALVRTALHNMKAIMIIRMDLYRAAPQVFRDDALDYRHILGNAVLAIKHKGRPASSPELPDVFDDFNARDFIERVYNLATQI
jgi:hypothetical protein